MAFLIKYQKLKIVVCSIWSEGHYTDCVIAHLSASIHHMSSICTSLHILQTTIFNCRYFILIAILFYYSTVVFNQNCIICGLWFNFDIF
jgi:hypothetical protein